MGEIKLVYLDGTIRFRKKRCVTQAHDVAQKKKAAFSDSLVVLLYELALGLFILLQHDGLVEGIFH